MPNYNPPTNGFNKNKQNINRVGPPRIGPVLKELRELNRTDLTTRFSEQLVKSKHELKAIVNDPLSVAKDVGIAQSILRWMDGGSFSYVQPYIEYIFGKPKEYIEHSGDKNETRIVLITPKDRHADRSIEAVKT